MMQRSRANEIRDHVRQLASNKKSRVNEARAQLSIIGGRAVEPLIEALEGDQPRIRARVMPLLAIIQDPRGRDPLIAMLLDRDDRMRRIAARSLGRFPSPASVAALNRLLEREEHPKVRKTAVQSLVEQYAAGQPQALCRALEILLDRSAGDSTRLGAFSLLRELPKRQRASVLARLKRDPRKKIRKKAEELEAAKPARYKASQTRAWIEELGAERYDTWMEALQRLRKCGARVVAPLVDEMHERANELDFCARAGILLRALGPRGAAAVSAALDRVSRPYPAQVLVETVGALGIKPLTYRLKDLIDRLAERRGAAEPGELEDGDGFGPWLRVRARAHLELARLGSRVAIADLRDAFEGLDRRVDLELLAAMRLIGKRDEIGLLLSAYHEEDSFARERIAQVVRTIMKRERIRRNSRVFDSLDAQQRLALARVLLTTAPRRRPRRAPAGPTSPKRRSGPAPGRVL
jgi:hypothetical protein